MILNLNRGAFGPTAYDWAGEAEFGRSGADWMVAIKSGSGTFRLKRTVAAADLLLVAGGMPGVKGASGGGTGGKGGGVLAVTGVMLPAGNYTVIIGGSGADTVLIGPDGTTWTAASGDGAEGGRSGSLAGGAGVYPWDDADTVLCTGWRFGPGGGVGKYSNTATSLGTHAAGPGGDLGAAPHEEDAGSGGPQGSAGHDGAANTGQGGGGGSYHFNGTSGSGKNGGAGGSGIILFRPHKEVSA